MGPQSRGSPNFENFGTLILRVLGQNAIWMCVYNTSGFRTETMYDYYIAMKSMFLVAKLFSHPSLIYTRLTILLSWTKHKQHQNHSKSKAFQNQKFNSHKLCIHTIILYKWKCFDITWAYEKTQSRQLMCLRKKCTWADE